MYFKKSVLPIFYENLSKEAQFDSNFIEIHFFFK